MPGLAYSAAFSIAGLAIWSLWNGRVVGSSQSPFKIHCFTNFAQEEDSLHWGWCRSLFFILLMPVTLFGEWNESESPFPICFFWKGTVGGSLQFFFIKTSKKHKSVQQRKEKKRKGKERNINTRLQRL
jgi:hypothetical protein